MTTLKLTTRYSRSLLTSLAAVTFGWAVDWLLELWAGRYDLLAKTPFATRCRLGRSASAPIIA